MLITEMILIALSPINTSEFIYTFLRGSWGSKHQHVAAYLLEDLRLLNKIRIKNVSFLRKELNISGRIQILDRSPTGIPILDDLMVKLSKHRKSLYRWIRFLGKERYNILGKEKYNIQTRILDQMVEDGLIKQIYGRYKILNLDKRNEIRKIVRNCLLSKKIPNQYMRSLIALCHVIKKWYINKNFIENKEFNRYWFKELKSWSKSIAKENTIAYWLSYGYRSRKNHIPYFP
ncbi:MAG: GPP34 family phosphoprotein [Promethearchaeota archaeon]